MALGQVSRVPRGEMSYRPATDDDLATCAAIWRRSTNDYTGRLNQADIPNDLAPILRLYAHLRRTDPDLFVVAERTDETEGTRMVAFVSALRRGPLWYLSMLFVVPEMQGAGLGRALLERVLPAAGTASLSTCTDSAQPISNALYASIGMTPRMPLLRLVGLPDHPDALAPLPDGIRAVQFDEIGDATGDGLGRAVLDDEVATLDREVIGFEHREDFDLIRREERIGFLYLGPDGAPIGYGFASEAGRVGPIAVRDAALLDPILGHLVRTVRPRGAFGVWVPGAAGTAMTSLLRAGFRIDGFPCLVCWDRPLIEFSRYIPISPGLL